MGTLHPKCLLNDLIQYIVARYDGILMSYLLKEPILEIEDENATTQNSKTWL